MDIFDVIIQNVASFQSNDQDLRNIFVNSEIYVLGLPKETTPKLNLIHFNCSSSML